MLNHYAPGENQEIRGGLREYKMDYQDCIWHAAERLLGCRGDPSYRLDNRFQVRHLIPNFGIRLEGIWTKRICRPPRRRP